MTSSVGRKSEGSSSSCESDPTHLIQEEGERRGAAGVWSPHAHWFLTTGQRRHRHCHRRTAFRKEDNMSGKSGQIQVSSLPQFKLSGCGVAEEQCGGREEVRKERGEEEGEFNK